MLGSGAAGLGEFELIEQFFRQPGAGLAAESENGRILLGIGDDCAVVEVAADRKLLMSIDTLVEGVHFLPGCDPDVLGWRSLAVNISDLAAMGADPWCFTLALTLPRADAFWLAGYSRGLFRLAQRYGMQLIGGDTTRGPLTLTLQVQGTIAGSPLTRSGAKPGDLVLVSGTLGDAAAALRFLDLPREAYSAPQQFLRRRYEYPEPRVAIGQKLRGLATAAIDVSDGLLADLGHICQRSGVGAWIDPTRLPLSRAIQSELPEDDALQCALEGGDDYELCFTLPPEKLRHVQSWVEERLVTVIGEITPEPGLRLRDSAGRLQEVQNRGYRHFEP